MNRVFVSNPSQSDSKPMKAARFYGKEDIRIKDDIPRPEVGEGQVKVEPAFVGICGTDLHEYLGGPKSAVSPSNHGKSASLMHYQLLADQPSSRDEGAGSYNPRTRVQRDCERARQRCLGLEDWPEGRRATDYLLLGMRSLQTRCRERVQQWRLHWP